jgi:hypothetical protein
MATTNGNRKILDLKRWEMVTPAPTATVAGAHIVSSNGVNQQQLYVVSATVAYLYNPYEDGWVQVPSPALTGAFGAGACGAGHPISFGSSVGITSLSALGGSNQTIITNQSLARDLRGYHVNILSGPNSGLTLGIVSNTVGANATIFVAPQASGFSTETRYRLITPRFYLLSAGTLAAGSYRVYDYATNTYISLSIVNFPATVGTDAKLVPTAAWHGHATDYNSFSVGLASAATTTTISDNTKTWTTNQWVNYQVRLKGGAGAGQIRTIISNTATSLGVATWITTPDTTSIYSIEANDDFLYFLGNNSVQLYRYSIGINTWIQLNPGVARGGAPGTGMSAHFIDDCTDSDWTNQSAILNGKYIYSFRGAAGALLDRYDIPLGIWSAVTYSPAVETFTTGTKYSYVDNSLYIQKDATGRWFDFNIPRSNMTGWTTMFYPNGAALLGDTAFNIVYKDGGTMINYVYILLNTSTITLRQMVI